MINILGYFRDRESGQEIHAGNVFVAIDEIADINNNLTIYAPIGQHGAASREYIINCKRITRQEYVEVTEGYYTPAEYLQTELSLTA